MKINPSGSPAPLRRELFPSKRPKVEGEKKITFVAIAPEAKSDKYIETLPPWMQEEALALEKLAEGFNSTKLRNIRSKIIQISKKREWNEQKQRAQLGILTYYVVTDRPIPGEASLIEHRTNELVTELEALKEQHQSADLAKQERSLIPSGTVCYLHRAFVRMIFPPSGSLNLGGCYAIKELLNGKISLHFSDEQRDQILNIVDKLIKEESFLLLFKDPFDVAKEWEEVVRIDNQLSPTEPMSFVYVRWALLNALFSVTGQLDNEGNCFAVATNMAALHLVPETLVSLLTQVLKTGTFDFEGEKIPVLLILKSRRHYDRDFEVIGERQRLAELAPFNVAQNSLGLEKEIDMATEPVFLNTLMEEHFGEDVAYAQEVFLSHKQSLLQQTTFALFQFIAINTFVAIGQKKSEKRILFGLFQESVLDFWYTNKGNALDADFMTFKSRVIEQMYRSFFLINFTNSHTEVIDKKVFFGFYTHNLQFDGNIDHYSIFDEITLLFYLHKNKLVLVDTIEAFKDALKGIVQQLLSPLDSSQMQEVQNGVLTWFSEDACSDQIAQTVYKYNCYDLPEKKHPISWEIYKDSNALLFAQRGGQGELILQSPYFNEYFDVPVNTQSTSVQDFFIKITGHIADFCKTHPDWEQSNKPMIIEASYHTYILTPCAFKEYWENPHLIQETIVKPGQVIARKKPSAEEKIRALSYTVGKQQARVLWNELPHGRWGVKRVREVFKQKLDSDLHTLFDNALNRVMQEITLEQIKHCLKDVCLKQGFQCEDQSYNKIIESLKGKNKTFFTPYEAAKQISKAVIKLNNSSFLDRDKLESSIRFRYHLPQVLKIGNLNWVTEYEEKTRFRFLVLKYDFAQESLTLAQRVSGQEFIEPMDSYLNGQLIFEK